MEEDCTSSLVVEIFYDSDQVGADIVLLHGCPQSCMSNPVKGLLEVYKDTVDVLLVLEIFATSPVAPMHHINHIDKNLKKKTFVVYDSDILEP